MNKAQEKTLTSKVRHITGECNCECTSSTCAYWKNVDKGGESWQTKLIIKEIKKCM